MRSVLLVLTLAFFSISCQNSPIATIEIEVTGADRYQTPILADVSTLSIPQEGIHLINKRTGTAIPATVDRNGTLHAVIPGLKVGLQEIEIYSGRVTDPAKISLEQTTEGIQVKSGENPVFLYQTKMAFPREGLPDYYKRNGMIHPLHSPGGQVVTDGFPEGHVHQHAIFNAWVNTQFKGEKVDFWNQHQGTGTVVHKEVVNVSEPGEPASFTVTQGHMSHKHGEVLEETWTVRIYPTGEGFLFDLYSNQLNISQDTLHIVEYHYGGMGFRGSREWNTVDTAHYTNEWRVLTDLGKTKESANHTKAKWVSAYGEVDGETVGLTVFGFPENFRYPQIVRVHPTMPYWVYSPMHEGAFYIAPGQNFQSRFRFYVHQGEANPEKNAALEADISAPVIVRVKQ